MDYLIVITNKKANRDNGGEVERNPSVPTKFERFKPLGRSGFFVFRRHGKPGGSYRFRKKRKGREEISLPCLFGVVWFIA